MIHEPTYRQAIQHSWSAVWHNKILWIFGLLAAFVGHFGLGELFSQLWYVSTKSGNTITNISSLFNTFFSGGDWRDIVGFVWLSAICLTLLAMVVFLAVSAQGAFVAYIISWFKNSKYNDVTKAWHRGIENFWHVLSINIARKIISIVFAFLALLLFKYFFISESIYASFAFFVSAGLVLLAYFIVCIVSIYAVGYAVADGQGFLSAISRAWQMFSKHLLVSLEVGVILIVFDFLAIVAVCFSFFIAFVPSLILWIVAGIFNSTGLAMVGAAIGFSLWAIFAVLLCGLLNAFIISSWMYLFIKMHKEGIVSRMGHWAKKMFV